ncbi:PREDICTED: uncharacterized protein LOC109126508 [Camelina sativa]|uniref:Uncharacterized protein LOC109126508 n=1 Tax=Camelina sativa TaxID=90675 RepID=A0ABM1QFY4_CAMSA|nr:PREDICTED: uncharacterized protein LOC109126508 [Camelina sativa]
METATIVHEPALPRTWRTDGNLRYEVAMNSIIITLNVAAILHMAMRTHQIPVDENVSGPVMIFTSTYALAILFNGLLWLEACDDDSLLCVTYFVGRLCHTFGFCIFLCLIYSISHLTLYITLPCLLWFIPAMIAPCCPQLWRGEPAWWNFVKQPQSTATIV